MQFMDLFPVSIDPDKSFVKNVAVILPILDKGKGFLVA